MPDGERRLAAIMFTDIVGYTALTQSNEAQAMQVLERHNRLLRPFFPRFHGREVKAMGDSFLVEFDSALDALRCATDIQSYLHDYNVSSKEEWKIKLRIGVHLGDVIHKGGDVFGDAVNIAERIRPLADPEGVCLSEQVYYQVQNKFDKPLAPLGEKSLKNVRKPVGAYKVVMPWEQSVQGENASYERSLVVLMFTDIVGYSALAEKDEVLAMKLLGEHRSLVRPLFSKHGGREVQTIGDAFFVEFSSALEAVRCAYAVQLAQHELNHNRPAGKRVQLRVGIHLGDVIYSEGEIYGHAVNLASRIGTFATPGGICISEQVHDQARNKLEFPMVSLGRKELKGIGEAVEMFKVVLPWEMQDEASQELDRNRVAILPFVNMSPDPNDEYFADGMTEEIISTVSGISGLQVISRTSVMRYKKTEKGVKEIGRELEVGSVLEGSFRKAGNKIRVTTQLIDVAADKHLWAQNYDRSLDDVFEVQSDIAKQVAEALRVKILTPEKERIEKKPTKNTDAYALYLKGRYLWNKRGPENIKKAIKCFEPAIKHDPDFAPAYVGLADCFGIMIDWGKLSVKEAAPKVRSLLAAALRIDEKLAEAHASLATQLEAEWEWSAAEVEYKRAIELNPNYSMGHMWYSNLLYCLGRVEEGSREIVVALELDPVSSQVNANFGTALQQEGRLEESIEQYRKTMALEPDFVAAHMGLGESYVMLSKFDEGIAEFRRAEDLAPGFAWPKGFIAYALAVAGRQADAKRILTEMEASSKGAGVVPALTAAVYFALGDNDKAYSLMEKCVEEHSYATNYVWTLPFFHAIQRERRFKELFEKAVRSA